MPRPFAPLALVAFGAALAGCSSSTMPSVTLWEGTLSPVPPASVSGQVAVVSQFGGIQTSLEIRLATPGATYRWRLAEGSCTTPGRVIGGVALYPQLTVGEGRTAQALTTLPGEFSTGKSYVALVFRLVDGGAEQPAACGPLVER